MEIRRLKLFRTIVETGSLRRAAELHGISPGALSKSMKQLERDLDVSLWLPSGRGIALTDAGRRVYAASAQVIAGFDSFMAAARDGGDAARQPFRIGSFEVFTTHFLGRLIERELPDASIELRELVPGRIERALLDREIDLGITYIPFPEPELDFVKAANLEMGIYGRKGAFKGRAFADLPFAVPITPVGASPAGLGSLDGWPRDRHPRRVKYRFELLESALEVCRRGKAAVFCPKFIAGLHNETVREELKLVGLPLPAGMRPVRQAVYLVKRKSDTESPLLRKTARALRSLLAPG